MKSCFSLDLNYFIQFNGRPMWRDNAIAYTEYLPPEPTRVKPLASLNNRDEMMENYEELLRTDIAPRAANFAFIPKMNGSPDWGERTSDGKKFVYTYR